MPSLPKLMSLQNRVAIVTVSIDLRPYSVSLY